ncbi:hypothetical protein AAMO2058_001404200 [Amorphochlora amoebiformis]
MAHTLPRKGSKRVVFLHPDLGIGGAEKLIVEAAYALKEKGHSVTVCTSHYDPKRCFEKTKEMDIYVAGDWLPRSLFGKLHILFALLRAVWLSICVVWSQKADVYITDQIAVYNGCLRLLCYTPIVFYCHFPDQLLSKRQSIIKKIYRIPFDLVEEITTGLADIVLVNSKFTGRIFRKTFRMLHHINLQILYPAVSLPPLEAVKKYKKEGSVISFLSINRYERKKNIALAIHAFAAFLKLLAEKKLSSEAKKNKDVKLIIAGGCDAKVRENIEYYEELNDLAYNHYNIPKYNLQFLRSFDDSEKENLIGSASCVLYTPEGEHFGIVPIEAMAHQTLVIALASGGPKESVVDNKTGFLCDKIPPDPNQWASRMMQVYSQPSRAAEMGRNGRRRVECVFSFSAFRDKFHEAVSTAGASDAVYRTLFVRAWMAGFCVLIIGLAMFIIRR